MTVTNDSAACGRCKHYEVGGHNVLGQVAGFCKKKQACVTLSNRRYVRRHGCKDYSLTKSTASTYKISSNSWRAGKSTKYVMWLESETVRLKMINRSLVSVLEKANQCDQFSCSSCRASIKTVLNLAKEEQ